MIYEYECQSSKCGVVSEVMQSLSDEPLKKCPVCKKGKVIKLISLTARPVVPESPREILAKIKRDAKKTAQKIIKGDEAAIADVYGEGSPKTPPPSTKVKTGSTKRIK